MTNTFSYFGPYVVPTAIHRPKVVNNVIRYLARSEYVSVLAPRQSGKSTFFTIDLTPQLTDSYEVCRLDLKDADKGSLVSIFSRAWQARDTVNGYSHPATSESAAATSVNEWLSRNVGQRTVVFLVDELPKNVDVVTLLLADIRSYFNEAKSKNLEKIHLFVFSGSEDLAFLTALGNLSLFNLCQEVYLDDFSEREAQGLIRKLVDGTDRQDLFDDETLSKVYLLTQGHPYLTQLLCSRLYDTPDQRDDVLMSASQAVEILKLEDELHIQAMMRHLADVEGMAKERALLMDLLTGRRTPRFTPTVRAHKRLQLQGCIREERGVCRIRNPIYEVVFQRFFEETETAVHQGVRRSMSDNDDWMTYLERGIRAFQGVLCVNVLGVDGPVSRQGDTEAPLFELGWGQEYRLSGVLVQGVRGCPETELTSRKPVSIAVTVPGDERKGSWVDYRLSPDSFTVDFSPQEVLFSFRGSGEDASSPGYFEFHFATPLRPRSKYAKAGLGTAQHEDSGITDVEAGDFRIFLKLFQWATVVQICELRFRVVGP